MQVNIREVEQVIVIGLTGRLVFESRKIFQKALQEAHGKSPRMIVLNMERITFLDSAGLGLLALGYEQAKVKHMLLCLVNPCGPVKHLLEMAQMQKMIPIHETEEQALRSPAFPLPA